MPKQKCSADTINLSSGHHKPHEHLTSLWRAISNAALSVPTKSHVLDPNSFQIKLFLLAGSTNDPSNPLPDLLHKQHLYNFRPGEIYDPQQYQSHPKLCTAPLLEFMESPHFIKMKYRHLL